ncbi:DNA primase [Mannheimia haemolytica]
MGGLLEHYREDPQYKIVEALANWDHLELPENIERTFIDTLDFLYAKLVELRKEELIAKDRTVGLTDDEKKEYALLMFQ